MPVHDWTRVEDGISHAFHVAWVTEIQKVLNHGLLPEGFYVLAEQHAGRAIVDVLTLHASPTVPEPPPLPPMSGGIALAEAPPRVRRKQTIEPAALTRRRSLAIRHVSGHRLVALIEIISPANKDRAGHVDDFVVKAVSALEAGVHLMVLDLLPPGPHDPHGLHGIIRQRLEQTEDDYDLPEDEPLTLAAYAAGLNVEVFLEHVGVGRVLPEMPLFLQTDRYINVPLEPTYQGAFEGLPQFWRNVLEGQPPLVS